MFSSASASSSLPASDDTIMLNQRAYSVIELLVSVCLATVVSFTMLDVLLSYHHRYLQSEYYFSLQEHQRLSAHLLSSVIETTAYLGCASIDDDFPIINNGSTQFFDAHNALQFFSSSSQDLPNFITAKLVHDSQVMVIRRGLPINDQLLLPVNGGHDLVTTAQLAFDPSDNIILSDCHHAELLHIQSVINSGQQQRITTTKTMKFDYPIAAQVSLLQVIAFYVADTGRQQHGQSVYALYQKIEGQSAQELVPDVQRLLVSHQGRYLRIELLFHHHVKQLILVALRE